MTVGPYVLPPPDPEREARELEPFKARLAGKTTGEALAMRLDLEGQIAQLTAPGNDWHDEALRDEAMARLARLRRQFAHVTAEIERGAYA
jgi:hypothetical protein